jgi:hypothetical protein
VATQEELTIVAELIDKLTPELKKIRGQIDKTEAKTTRSFKQMELASDRFRGALRKVGGALKLGGVAATAFGTIASVSMSKTAAEAEAVRGKFSVVFGELAENSSAAAVAIAQSFGRAETDVLRFFATFQDTFVPFGFARAEAADLSEQVTKLAIDLASFNDVADDQALQDLQSALVGNVETMRKYGVVINQTVLDQELLRMGVEGGAAAATEQEKVLGRLNLIFAGTADAQGDAVRTSGEFNNTLKRLGAVVTSAKEKFGAWINEGVLVAIEKLGGTDGFRSIVESILGTVGALSSELVKLAGTGLGKLNDAIDQFGGSEAVVDAVRIAIMELSLEFQIFLAQVSIKLVDFSQSTLAKLAGLGGGAQTLTGELETLRAQMARFEETGQWLGAQGGLFGISGESVDDVRERIAEIEALLEGPMGNVKRLEGELAKLRAGGVSDSKEAADATDDETAALERQESQVRNNEEAARRAADQWERIQTIMLAIRGFGFSVARVMARGLPPGGPSAEPEPTGDQPSFATGYEPFVAPKKGGPGAMVLKMAKFAYTKGVEGIQKYREELRRLEIQQMKMAAADMLASTFADIVSGAKKASDAIKDLASNFLRFFAQAAGQKAFGQILGVTGTGFANGGIVPGGGLSGAVPVKGYANGGPVFKGPHIGIIGEGRYNEAAVPLPDGKRIPVDLRGAGEGMGSTNVTFNVSAVDAESVASLFARNGQELADVVMARFQRDPNTRGMVMGGMA